MFFLSPHADDSRTRLLVSCDHERVWLKGLPCLCQSLTLWTEGSMPYKLCKLAAGKAKLGESRIREIA